MPRSTSTAPASLHYALGLSSLGAILVARSESGLRAILLGDSPGELTDDLRRRFPTATLQRGDAETERFLRRVVRVVESPRETTDIPLDPVGSPFQRRVWQALQRIPAGATATYTEIAARIGAPRAVRAVARACAANALAVLVPCHRVIRADGGLSGYRWGVERKRTLLAREAGA